MKNREVYQTELLDLMVAGVSFGVNKFTGEPCECDEDNPDTCKVCKFSDTEYSCVEYRKQWLESEQWIPKLDFEFQQGDVVYSYDMTGRVLEYDYFATNHDKRVNAFGNMCKSREYMEQRVQQIRLYNLLSNFAHDVNQGWKPDWNAAPERKWYVCIEHFDHVVRVDYTCVYENLNTVYFKTRDLAERAATEIVQPFIREEQENEK